MDVVSQTMDALMSANAVQNNAAKTQDTRPVAERDKFDKMLEDKYKTSKDTEKTEAEQDAPKSEESEAAPVEEPGQEQYVLMAALWMQPKPEIVYVEDAPQAEETAIVEVVQTAETQVKDTADDVVLPEEAAPVQEAAPREFHTDLTRTTEEYARSGEEPVQDGPVVKTEETIQEESVQVEQPVFEQVEATPVKVAPPETNEVALERPEAVKELAQQLSQAVKQGAETVEVTLVPAKLGKLTVQITRENSGALHIAITASTDKAASLLEQHGGNLQHLLAASAHSDVRVEVHNANQNHQQQFMMNPDGGQRQQRQQQQQRQKREDTEDFMQRLRLGLVSLSSL